MLKKISKFLTVITTVMVVAFAVTLIGYNTANSLGYRTYIVESGSMEPTIHTGSLVIANTNQREATVNDIVVFFVGEKEDRLMVTHRIVGVTSEGDFITKGDGNAQVDVMTLSPDRVLGEVVTSIPRMGFILSNTKDTNGIQKTAVYVIGLWIISLIVCKIVHGEQLQN